MRGAYPYSRSPSKPVCPKIFARGNAMAENMREFAPGELPAGLDLGDKFDVEGSAYQVKSVSSGGWIFAGGAGGFRTCGFLR